MKRLPVLLLLSLAALSAAADRRLLPPAIVDSREVYVTDAGTDGANFLVVGTVGTHYDYFLFDANGNALRAAQLLPAPQVHAIAWAGHYFVFTDDGVIRIASDGTLLDRVAQALPFTPDPSYEIASDGERLLVRGEHALFFVDRHALATELVLPFGESDVKSFASDGERFVLLRNVDAVARFTIVDGDAVTHVDRTAPAPIGRPLLASDGATWAIFDRDSEPHLYLFDRDLHFTASKWTSGQITVHQAFGIPGGGYVASAEAQRPPLNPKPFLIEFRPPSYIAGSSVELLLPRSIAVSAHAIAVVDNAALPLFLGPSLGAWSTAPKPRFPAGVELRGSFVAETNDDALTLLTWRQPSRPNTILAARVRPDDTVIDTTPIELAQSCGGVPSIADDGRDFLLVWNECNDTMATAAISAEHGLTHVRRLQAPNELGSVRAVSNGTYFGALWSAFDFGLQREAVQGLMLDRTGNSIIGATPTPGVLLGVARSGDGYMIAGYNPGPFTQKLDQTLAPAGPRTNINNHVIVIPSTFAAGLGGFFYVSAVQGTVLQWKLLYLDANGRLMSTAEMAQTSFVFTPARIHCASATECTILTRRTVAGLELLEASSITKDDKDQIAIGEPRVLAASVPGHPRALQPVLFEGTASAPKRLWYSRYDETTGSYDIFVREPKSRAVRR